MVADCLETTLEVGETYKEQFKAAGGDTWQLVDSLNDHPLWIACLQDLVLKNNDIIPLASDNENFQVKTKTTPAFDSFPDETKGILKK